MWILKLVKRQFCFPKVIHIFYIIIFRLIYQSIFDIIYSRLYRFGRQFCYRLMILTGCDRIFLQHETDPHTTKYSNTKKEDCWGIQGRSYRTICTGAIPKTGRERAFSSGSTFITIRSVFEQGECFVSQNKHKKRASLSLLWLISSGTRSNALRVNGYSSSGRNKTICRV